MDKSQKTINCDYCSVSKQLKVGKIDVQETLQQMLQAMHTASLPGSTIADDSFQEALEAIASKSNLILIDPSI